MSNDNFTTECWDATTQAASSALYTAIIYSLWLTQTTTAVNAD
ncbi:MAG: hypothetical protein ACRCZS_04755 [Chroococcidiopsis sp.]